MKPIEVILVDKNDTPLGTAEKLYAHENALCHRAFSVFILRKTDFGVEVLLQKRADHKYHCGGLWTNTCCSHPAPGEEIKASAEKRLAEEMGFHADLQPVGLFHYKAEFDNGLTENEVDHVFIAFENPASIPFNPEEVSEIKWISLRDLKEDLNNNAIRYTPWFAQALSLVERAL